MVNSFSVIKGTKIISSPCGDKDNRRCVPIETLRQGDLVLTHHNRMMPILDIKSHQYTGEMLEVNFAGITDSL